MSKLAHSNDDTMASIERSRMIAECGKKIKTSFDYPPIPWRNFDWCAYFDGEEEEGRYGYGATENEAIDDLLERTLS